MHAFRPINISIRTQAAFVMALTALWYVSIWLALRSDGFVSGLSLPWMAAAVFGPFITVVFAAIMFISQRRTGCAHRRWVITALVVAVSPWILFLMLLADAGFL